MVKAIALFLARCVVNLLRIISIINTPQPEVEGYFINLPENILHYLFYKNSES